MNKMGNPAQPWCIRQVRGLLWKEDQAINPSAVKNLHTCFFSCIIWIYGEHFQHPIFKYDILGLRTTKNV